LKCGLLFCTGFRLLSSFVLYEVELLKLVMPNLAVGWQTLFVTTYKTHNSWSINAQDENGNLVFCHLYCSSYAIQPLL
jgi:hypothetical protein